jgi:hypothetical protein
MCKSVKLNISTWRNGSSLSAYVSARLIKSLSIGRYIFCLSHFGWLTHRVDGLLFTALPLYLFSELNKRSCLLAILKGNFRVATLMDINLISIWMEEKDLDANFVKQCTFLYLCI